MDLASPYDAISSELGLSSGLPREFAASLNAQQQATPSSAMFANQALMMRAIGANPVPMSMGNAGPPQRKTYESPEKTDRRRKREREAAQRSRKRKQNRVEELEHKMAILERENAMLREELKASNIDTLISERDNLVERLRAQFDAVDRAQFAMSMRDVSDLIAPIMTELGAVNDHIVAVNTKSAESIVSSLDSLDQMHIVLWMFMDGPGQHGGASAREAAAASGGGGGGGASADQIMRTISTNITEQIRSDIHLTAMQFAKIVEARDKYFASFKQAYDRNQHVLDLVNELEQRRASMAHYLNVAKSFREHVLHKVMTDQQQARLVIWLQERRQLLKHLYATATTPDANAMVDDAGLAD